MVEQHIVLVPTGPFLAGVTIRMFLINLFKILKMIWR
jgi:hypothetical protein